MKVLVTTPSFIETPGKHQELLRAQNFDCKLVKGPLSSKVLLENYDEHDAILCGDDHFDQNFIEVAAARGLKIISKYGVGLDKIDLDSCKKNNVSVRNCVGVNQNAVAEHVFALLLSYNRRIFEIVSSTRNGDWVRKTGLELDQKKFGILGFGKIGQRVSGLAKAFGMTVLACDPYASDEVFLSQGVAPATLGELVRNCDYLSLHAPLNSETKGLVNGRLLKKANPNLVLINTARGSLVDEAELYEALVGKKIAAYLTDVMEVEPMIKNHALSKLDNVLITGHVASRTLENVQRQGLMAVENLLDEIKRRGL